jgi:hypothetical protein
MLECRPLWLNHPVFHHICFALQRSDADRLKRRSRKTPQAETSEDKLFPHLIVSGSRQESNRNLNGNQDSSKPGVYDWNRPEDD